MAGLSLAVDEDTDIMTKCVSRTRWSKLHKPVFLCLRAVTAAGLPSAVYEETNMVIRDTRILNLICFRKPALRPLKPHEKLLAIHRVSNPSLEASGYRKIVIIVVVVQIGKYQSYWCKSNKSVYVGSKPYHQESPWAAWWCLRRPALLCTRVTARTHLCAT